MNRYAESTHEGRLAAVETDIVKEVTAHMDTWIDHMCEYADQLLQTDLEFTPPPESGNCQNRRNCTKSQN